MSSAATVSAILPAPDPEDRFLMFPNEALDQIGYLDPYELTTYAHLLRLTRGFHVSSKRIGLERLEQRTSIGRTKLKSTIRALENKGLVHVDETPGRTNLYTVVLPRELSNLKESAIPIKKSVEEEPQQNEETLTLVESHKTTQPSHDTTTLKETSEKEQDPIHTQEQVCVDGPVLALKDLTDGSGFNAPLAGVTQGVLDSAYKTVGSWDVMRLFITLILGYLYKVEILNPIALIKWALKSKDFIKLSNKDIATEFLNKIKYFIGHLNKTEVHFLEKEINELKLFSKWIEINFEKIDLKLLYDEYHNQCKASAVSYKFIWFFMIPNPTPKHRNKKQ